MSSGSAGLNEQSSFPQTVKQLLSWQQGFHICMLHISPFSSCLFILSSGFSRFLSSPLCVHPPLTLFFFPSFLSLRPNVLESCCSLMNVLDFYYPHLSHSLFPFLSLSRRRGVLFLIKASAPELTQQATKSHHHHHHHHPWEPINNSACCPMHHYAWRFQLSPGQSEHSHT